MDLVTFGEAMVRLSPPAGERLDDARRFDVHVGGSELNVAVGAARLGLRTRWVSRLAETPLGRLIARPAGEAGRGPPARPAGGGGAAGRVFVGHARRGADPPPPRAT